MDIINKFQNDMEAFSFFKRYVFTCFKLGKKALEISVELKQVWDKAPTL